MPGKIEIKAIPRRGMGPMDVQFEAIVTELEGEIRFRWHFGDGEESSAEVPPSHRYQAGQYSVLLEAVDGSGRRYTASIGVDAASPG
jgi:PKD repeat protein